MTDIAIHQSERDALEGVIRAEGLDDNGASPHSWRCEYPDRYPGACHCVEWMRDAILEAGFRQVADEMLEIEAPDDTTLVPVPPPPLSMIPRTLMLDVWEALGLDRLEFAEWYQSKAETVAWAELLTGIRQAANSA
jgi:hypothetical protein